ncbi:RNA methyltransferase [Helicobacter monodelphidis]|uniref:tRNA (cytidine(34)-2'-O)-methyltransferase n=1 Tax=Helicobacter sp. 15-1451 TaxID=2004995 RepID=UPI000DCCD3C7|nr:tRNA (cytidine(34)-2'-O)-methyltransferase [Helicobacter sp. 15-1451]RAX59207.1 RNA methyltransferase [Helicobacter sp. 15-1451]
MRSSRLNIVLFEPRIPHNTGAIGRLCVSGGAALHLIHPLGFHLNAKEIRRSGLDYWEHLDLFEWACLQELWEAHPPSGKEFFITTKGSKSYYSASFQEESFIFFGREDQGFSQEIYKVYQQSCFKIPMQPQARSLNLATAVAIVLYEAIRQIGL